MECPDATCEEPSNADEIIRKVHAGSQDEYRRAKMRKQAELSHKIVAAESNGSAALVKSEKKRVDNHASAVASRLKQEYLIASFEDQIRHMQAKHLALAAACREQKRLIDKQDDTIRAQSNHIANMMERHMATSNLRNPLEAHILSQAAVVGHRAAITSTRAPTPPQRVSRQGGVTAPFLPPESSVAIMDVVGPITDMIDERVPSALSTDSHIRVSPLSSTLEPKQEDFIWEPFSKHATLDLKQDDFSWDAFAKQFVTRQGSWRSSVQYDDSDSEIINPVA